MNQLAVHQQDHQWFLYGREKNFKNLQDGCHPWMRSMDDGVGDPTSSSSSSSFIGENSSSSSAAAASSTLCSLDTTDDASSSSSSPTSCSSNGPSLFDLTSLMCQLPIKRGLSKFYNGKSESFTSLSRVTSTQDLAKKETPYTRRMKGCKSCRAGLDAYKSYTSPAPIITKKISSSSSSSSPSSSSQSRRGRRSFISSRRSKPPLVPVRENHP